MEKTTQYFLTLTSSIILLLAAPGQTAGACKPESCHPTLGPTVRFPFRLEGRGQPARCGYPGFDLRCNDRNHTILRLPRSGDFIVQHIDYRASALYVGDPGFCLAGRGLNFSVESSPFDATYLRSFGILNCSGEGLADDMGRGSYYLVLPCLSVGNATVLAVDTDLPEEMVPPPCRRAGNVTVPPWSFSEFYWGSMGPEVNFQLRWSTPACGRCEGRGGRCGFKDDWGSEIGCNKSSGLSRSAKYAVIVGIGIPGLLCMITLIYYACRKIKIDRHQRRVSNELPMSTFDRQFLVRAASGLDQTTIESYPKTELGQSRRLPNPSDNTCSICLSDYQPKETLKSIPECNHYFHATCIDEWLKLNGTCPLCRNSPETSSATPTSSTLLSPSSTASNHN